MEMGFIKKRVQIYGSGTVTIYQGGYVVKPR